MSDDGTTMDDGTPVVLTMDLDPDTTVQVGQNGAIAFLNADGTPWTQNQVDDSGLLDDLKCLWQLSK